MARRPFLISFTFSSAKVSGSSARPCRRGEGERGAGGSVRAVGGVLGWLRVQAAGTTHHDGRGDSSARHETHASRRAASPAQRRAAAHQGVEVATGVQGVQAQVLGDATVGAEGLSAAHQHHLASPDGQDGLGVHQVLVAQVVQTTLLEDLGTGLEPAGGGGWRSGAGRQVLLGRCQISDLGRGAAGGSCLVCPADAGCCPTVQWG